MKTKLTLEFNDTEEEMRFAKFISYHTEISSALFQITTKPQRKPTHFRRWMNLVNISYQVFVYVVTIQYICSMEEELRIRISSKLKKELESKARELNISLSAYVRMKLSSND